MLDRLRTRRGRRSKKTPVRVLGSKADVAEEDLEGTPADSVAFEADPAQRPRGVAHREHFAVVKLVAGYGRPVDGEVFFGGREHLPGRRRYGSTPQGET